MIVKNKRKINNANEKNETSVKPIHKESDEGKNLPKKFLTQK